MLGMEDMQPRSYEYKIYNLILPVTKLNFYRRRKNIFFSIHFSTRRHSLYPPLKYHYSDYTTASAILLNSLVDIKDATSDYWRYIATIFQ